MKKWLLSAALLFTALLITQSGCVSNVQTEPQRTKSLVAYFSYSGTTAVFAQDNAKLTSSDLYRIEAEVPYSQEDIDVKNPNSRVSLEQADDKARPAIAKPLANLDDYQIIYLGYPIWLSKAPKLIYSFVEKYDLKGKTIIPFCTSHLSGIGESADMLEAIAPEAVWKQGHGFTADDVERDVKVFLENLKL